MSAREPLRGHVDSPVGKRMKMRRMLLQLPLTRPRTSPPPPGAAPPSSQQDLHEPRARHSARDPPVVKASVCGGKSTSAASRARACSSSGLSAAADGLAWWCLAPSRGQKKNRSLWRILEKKIHSKFIYLYTSTFVY